MEPGAAGGGGELAGRSRAHQKAGPPSRAAGFCSGENGRASGAAAVAGQSQAEAQQGQGTGAD
jgi:hypothetical protein